MVDANNAHGFVKALMTSPVILQELPHPRHRTWMAGFFDVSYVSAPFPSTKRTSADSDVHRSWVTSSLAGEPLFARCIDITGVDFSAGFFLYVEFSNQLVQHGVVTTDFLTGLRAYHE